MIDHVRNAANGSAQNRDKGESSTKRKYGRNKDQKEERAMQNVLHISRNMTLTGC